jgi:translation initiation factor 2 subunit 1
LFYKKQGFPEQGELVICTVKKILPHCAFVILDEYENKEGMLHISEISSRWVKNIKDHISEGKNIVCKVLSVDKEKNYIDVSLKRVTPTEIKTKMNQWKIENKVEKVLEIIGKKFNMNIEQVYKEIGNKILERYGTFSSFFEEVKNKGMDALENLDIPNEWKNELYKFIEESIKISMVKIKGLLNINCMEGDGVDRIKKLFCLMKEEAKKEKLDLNFLYAGGGKYIYQIKARNYKEGENKLNKLFEEVSKLAKQDKIEFNVVK